MTGPDIDQLEETVRGAHAKAMEALAADVHPYSASAIREWEQAFDAALSDLAARARKSYPESWNEEIREVEDDRDRLARRVAELEAALRELKALSRYGPRMNAEHVAQIADKAAAGDGGWRVTRSSAWLRLCSATVALGVAWAEFKLALDAYRDGGGA